jgi:hypothetical protein
MGKQCSHWSNLENFETFNASNVSLMAASGANTLKYFLYVDFGGTVTL